MIFSASDDWIGGTYYILNLINALKILPAKKQPEITIFSKNQSDFLFAKETGYPFIKFRNPYITQRNFPERIIDKFFITFTGKYIIDKRVSAKDIDVVFPANNEWVYERVKKKIFWFPDFQHVVYPNFFSEQERKNRDFVLEEIANSNHSLLLSSFSAKLDWDALPFNKNCNVHIIPFAVTHPPIDDIDITKTLFEFKINGNYFIISNQFWIHKNHMVVLKAALILKLENIFVQFVFTGKEDDYRHSGYFETIIDFISLNNLETHVKILGLIDRRKQLKLMQHANAVIQPSLFEGWSTVIEDAKLLGNKVIASNIEVHKEQLKDKGIFFDPSEETDLVDRIKECLKNNYVFKSNNYKSQLNSFATSFYEIIKKK